jgi:recombinational DNA repair protein (RecF pathway)
MQLGTELQTHHCARCHDRLELPAVYQDSAWYHRRCWQEGEHQLANATRLATAFKFQSCPPMIQHLYSDLV